MMNQVTHVVNDTLVSAEEWCSRLGKRMPAAAQPVLANGHAEKDMHPDFQERETTLRDHDRSRTVTQGLENDTKMEM